MTWLYPSFLWALLALSVPIIVHLFNFRRYKKITFTNLRFLKQINHQTKSGNQLRKLLILASRLLALACLIMAFAQPIILHNNQTLNGSKELYSIIIDNSYSMNNSGPEGPLLEAAKNRARAIVNAAKNNDRFQIITADMNAALMHTTGKQATLENIDLIRINPGSKTLPQLLQLQERLVSNSTENKNLFVISDFQKNNPAEGNSGNDSNILKTWIKIPNEKAANISIDTCYLNSPVLQAGETIQLTARVSNYSENEVSGLTVDLLVDNKPKGIAVFDIKPFSSATQVFNFVLETGGVHDCVLQHHGDNMGFDDKLYFSLNLKNDFNVLNIYDRKEHYIHNVFNETKGFVYTGIPSGNVQYNAFGKASLICVEGSSSLSNGMAGELKKYVGNGGNLFVFPQSGMENGGLQSLAMNFNFAVAVQPTVLNGKVSGFDLENPLFKNIFDKIPKNPDLPSVKRYFNLTAANGNAVMTLSNGSPFIVQMRSGKGNIFICASPLDQEYTNLQTHAFFVPVLMKSAMLSSYHSTLYYQCGQTENIATGISFDTEKGIVLKSGNNSFIPEVINTNGEIFLNTNGEIEQAGWYKLHRNIQDSALMSLSFNMNRIESDTRTFSDAELENMASKNGARLYSGSAENLEAEYSASIKGTPLWKWCIILVLFFLLIEILLIRFLKPNAKLSA